MQTSIQERADAACKIAERRAYRMGGADNIARQVGHYARTLVLTGTSAHRAIGMAEEYAAKMAVRWALRRAAHYAEVRIGDAGWGEEK